MSIYLAIAAKSFQRSLTYRAANVAGIITNTFFAAVYVFVYVALLKGRGTVGGLDMRDAITYVIVSQSLLMAMSAFGNRDLSEAIIRGEIVSDLCRPVDFYGMWAAIDLGRGVYYLIFRGIPTYVLGAVLFGIRHPADPLAWGAFALCLLSGMVISFAFRFIANSLAFWTTDARGLNYLTNTVVMFFSGFIVPLNFFPPSLRTLTEWLPFRALAHLPISVYLGKVSGAELALALAQQAIWLVVLVAIGRWVLGRMVRRLAINGG
ncbi:MAG: ABC-2 family transporter protein [Chloroflexi bacterium]|nr:ABC-2 family transporter protein [Chloroflexota bacterium]